MQTACWPTPATLSLPLRAQECLDKFTESLNHKLDSHAVRGAQEGLVAGSSAVRGLTLPCPLLLPARPQELLDATQHTLQQQIQTLVKE